MNRREQDAHEDLCRRLVTALNERDAARAEVARLRGVVETYLARAYPNGRHVVSTADLRAALVPVHMPRSPRSEVWEPGDFGEPA